jgi:CRP-like cAMP-binding protein
MITAVETALERRLSAQVMSEGVKPKIRKIKSGEALVRQGDPGRDVFLILDGVLLVEKDGERLAEYGPGAMLGERAHLEESGRTSSLIAVTPCRVASVDAAALDRSSLHELSQGHRREHALD